MDPSAMTGAVYPGTIPLGATVRVTLADDPSKSVDVVVNDHGLYNVKDGKRQPLSGRAIDLSPAAFKQLTGDLKGGPPQVKVTIVKLPKGASK